MGDDDKVQWGSEAATAFRDEIQGIVATSPSKHGVSMLEMAAVLQYCASRAWFLLSPEYQWEDDDEAS